MSASAVEWTAFAVLAAAIAALGSVLAAAVTFCLAAKTRQAVQLGQAEVARLGPLIADIPPFEGAGVTSLEHDEAEHRCRVPYRNVGASTAIVASVRAGPIGRWVAADSSHHVLPPGETGWVTVMLPDQGEGSVAVEIVYTDVAGAHPTRSRLTLGAGDDGWQVRGVALYDGTDLRPRARAGQLVAGEATASTEAVERIADNLEHLVVELRAEIQSGPDFERLAQISDQIAASAHGAAEILSSASDALVPPISDTAPIVSLEHRAPRPSRSPRSLAFAFRAASAGVFSSRP